MLDAETRYPEVENLCLCLFFTCTKLRHILLTAEIVIICKSDVVKHMLSAPVLKGRLGKWMFALSEFDLRYQPAKVVKGQALADLIAERINTDIATLTTREKPIGGGKWCRRTTLDMRRWKGLPAHHISAAPAMKDYCRCTSGKDSPALFPGMAPADSGQAQESLPAHRPSGAPVEKLLLPAHPWAGAPAMILGPGPGVI
jgi:hypothetical protein